ncbi:MAG: sulfatase [Proteobacteria bacterium]|nr:sulfatase [Pseudomonadota bacterium]
MLSNYKHSTIVVVVILCALGSCDSDPAKSRASKQRSADSPSPGDVQRSPPAVAERPRVSSRTELATHRPLLDEAGRAELDAGGLLIDMGSFDQHKYTRGGWNNAWGRSKVSPPGITYAEVNGRRVHLDVMTRSAVGDFVMRVRAGKKQQRVTVQLGDKTLGHASFGTEWQDVTIPVAGGSVSPGRHELRLTFGRSKKGGPRAEIDWIWLRSEPDVAPALPIPRIMSIAVGGTPKRALPAPTRRAYSFYLQVPETGALVFDYGADKPVAFKVGVQADGTPARELFSQSAAAGQWKEAKVDLSEFAGKAIRLDLITEGPAAVAGWGEPELMVKPEKLASKTAKPKAPAGKPPRNVLVLVIDTVRADMFAPFADNPPAATPAFDAFAEKSTVFVNAYNNENWTKPSVATTLSGLYPVTHDTKQDPSVLPRDVELLSERLKSEGFATAGFVANGFISKKFGFEQGWDRFRNYIREERKSDAEHVYADALAWLESINNSKPAATGDGTDKGTPAATGDGTDKGKPAFRSDKPFFLYLQTIDPHVIYSVDRQYTRPYFPDEYKGPIGSSLSGQEQADISRGKRKVGKRDYDWIRALYYGEVTYHDEHMGRFFAEIEQRGILDDTLVVITNDHGEELNEHGHLGHGHSLYDELLRAPLLFHYPPLFAAGNRITEVVEHVDVTPTILDTLRLRPMKDADGQSLLPVIRGEPITRPLYAVAEFLDHGRAIRVGRWKLVRGPRTLGDLYDIAEDAAEQKNRVEEALIALRLCEVYMGEALATPAKRLRGQERAQQIKFKSSDANIDPKLRKQLEALGYFGG